MQIVTKFNPGDEVHFMLENKAVKGTVERVFTKAYVNLKEPVLEINYHIKYVFEKKVDSSLGFAGNQETISEKYMILNEKEIFPNKEELIKSL